LSGVVFDESRRANPAANQMSAPPNPPRAPLAERDACRERSTDRSAPNTDAEADGVLVVEDRVDAV